MTSQTQTIQANHCHITVNTIRLIADKVYGENGGPCVAEAPGPGREGR